MQFALDLRRETSNNCRYATCVLYKIQPGIHRSAHVEPIGCEQFQKSSRQYIQYVPSWKTQPSGRPSLIVSQMGLVSVVRFIQSVGRSVDRSVGRSVKMTSLVRRTVSPSRKVVGHEVLRQYVANVQVDDPVHEIEAHKTDGEYNAAVPVDV